MSGNGSVNVYSYKTNSLFMKTIFLIFALGIFSTYSSIAQQDYTIRKKHFNIDATGLALQGYDPVSYFEGKPTKGETKLFLYHKGIKYIFTTQAHLEAFKLNPDKYEPAYGGWCSYAMGKYGEKVEVDPMKYKIVDGKLNLFYYSIINNTLNKWNEDERNLKINADKNWFNTTK